MAKRSKQRHVRCLEKHREDLCVSTPNALYVPTWRHSLVGVGGLQRSSGRKYPYFRAKLGEFPRT